MTEAALREKLGLPADARRVLVFCESSHWDTSWLATSDEAFERRCAPILDRVLAALAADPRRVWGAESVHFLKLYWERRPGAREQLARLVARRQLRILSASLTTPDTLLPHPEALLRDFQLGQAWLDGVGLGGDVHTATFPDSFGHSPHLPSLLHALGVEAAAVTRVDGMHFIGADWRSRRQFPFAGSSAALLTERRALDFVWRADDGAEILCHWNAFGYFQGDMIAHLGAVRWNGLAAAIPWRTRRHLARRIDAYVRALEPLSPTPYLLCPIGMDFNDPVDRLPELLDRYNRDRFGASGTWAALAGLDDYFDLVGSRRAALPVLALDPNPTWMGCYASRPEVKRRPSRIARSLVLAEALAAFAPEDPEVAASLNEGWSRLVLVNHHDTMTGTSPDRVYEGEQRGWMDDAERATTRALALVRRAVPLRTPGEARVEGGPPTERGHGVGGPRVRRLADRALSLEWPRIALVFSEARGGCLTSLRLDGEELLAGLGLDLVAYDDEGGLWRLGHEFLGGAFREVDRASRRPAGLEVSGGAGTAVVTSRCELRGRRFRRTVTIRAGEPFLLIETDGAAAPRCTVTGRLELARVPGELTMDTVGGRITRPAERHYRPTFWPVPSQLSLASGLHAVFDAPSAVSLSARPPGGHLEWIAARNATKERAFGFLPVPAHPIGGNSDRDEVHRLVLFRSATGAAAAGLFRRAAAILSPAELRPLSALLEALVRCGDPGVTVAAVKRAEGGDGVVVRLASEPGASRRVRLLLPSLAITAARLCDALERDLGEIEVRGGEALVPIERRWTTVRLRVSQPAGHAAPDRRPI